MWLKGKYYEPYVLQKHEELNSGASGALYGVERQNKKVGLTMENSMEVP